MRNPIQNYAWGARDTLAAMRGIEPPTPEPEAELWVGAHPKSPSVIDTDRGAGKSLSDAVAESPRDFLPDGVTEFPFLLKVLAIAAPLSLQVHPSVEQAREGFEREEKAGVSPDAVSRNYKDRQSKPETVIALSTVRILTGIRPAAELRRIAEALNLRWLADLADLDAARLITAIFDKDDAAAARDLHATVSAAQDWITEHGADIRAMTEENASSGDPVTDLADLVLTLHEAYPGDRGILVATAMNQLFLEPGDAAFTPDGQVHAYISGTAVEIMNASDNVMRAGLTPKHIDVPEMLSVLVADQPAPEVSKPERIARGVWRYGTWDPRLTVTRLDVEASAPLDYRAEGTAALLCVDGEVTVEGAGGTYRLAGTASILHTGSPDDIRLTGAGRLYCASYV